jgi:hypothetical protein
MFWLHASLLKHSRLKTVEAAAWEGGGRVGTVGTFRCLRGQRSQVTRDLKQSTTDPKSTPYLPACTDMDFPVMEKEYRTVSCTSGVAPTSSSSIQPFTLDLCR